MKTLGTLVALSALCLIFSGCGGGAAPAVLVPVSGTVTIDGEPAADIMVQFVPKTQDEGVNAPTSQGLTDASGKFVLKTHKAEDGAIEGSHLVRLTDTLEERPAQGEEATNTSRLAPRWSSPGVEMTVKAGEDITIEATSN